MRQGLFYAMGAFVAWGLFPLYFGQLAALAPAAIIAHRVLWSSLLLVVWFGWRGELGGLLKGLGRPEVLRTYGASALLIGFNWLWFVRAVERHEVMAVSLGYFINPLINVVLGVWLFQDRLRALQWVAIAIAAVGVLYLAVSHREGLVTALVLAFSFALYGAVKKGAPLPPVEGMFAESVLLLAPAIGYLALGVAGSPLRLGGDPRLWVLLLGTGVVSTIPLVWFAAAARRLSLVVLGLVQYVAPTLQWLDAWRVSHEPFPSALRVGFLWVWAGILLSVVEGVWTAYRRRGGGGRGGLCEEGL